MMVVVIVVLVSQVSFINSLIVMVKKAGKFFCVKIVLSEKLLTGKVLKLSNNVTLAVVKQKDQSIEPEQRQFPAISARSLGEAQARATTSPAGGIKGGGRGDLPPPYLDLWDNLEHDMLESALKGEYIKECNPGVKAIQCENGCGKPHFYKDGCENNDCIECQETNDHRRAEQVFRRLKFTGKGAQEWSFTMPVEVRPRFSNKESLDQARRFIWNLLRELDGWTRKTRKEYKGYAVEGTHPIGDKDKMKYHPHFNFLIVPHGRILRISKKKLKLVKEKWAEYLSAEVVDVYLKLVMPKDTEKLYHRSKYVSRVFPGFMSLLGLRIRWYGHYPTEAELPDTKTCLCPECGGSFQSVSFGSAWIIEYGSWDNLVQTLEESGLCLYDLRAFLARKG